MPLTLSVPASKEALVSVGLGVAVLTVVSVTLKLTREEREVALELPFVSEARYVGRYGWITARIEDEDCLEATLEWMRESYWLKAPADVREAAWA